MRTIKTLENVSLEQLSTAFNLSFSDYIVPYFLTKENLEEKIKGDRICLELSVGVFENNQLVAFILHGFDIVDNLKIVYNAGTGVIPTKRGNKLTIRLFEFILPILRKNNIAKIVLEVIKTNEIALKTYQKIGFKTVTVLNCYKGSINLTNSNPDFQLRQQESFDWQYVQAFWDVKPSWQNSVAAVENLGESTTSIGAYSGEKLLGYAVYNFKNKKLLQVSVDKNYRKKGIATQLIAFIASNFGKDILVLNIDQRSKESLLFMSKIGLDVFIEQYEMELKLE